MKNLILLSLFLFFTQAQAQTLKSQFRYEGFLENNEGPVEKLNQNFTVTIMQEGCTVELSALTAWSSASKSISIDIKKGEFNLTPQFDKDVLSYAMNPTTDFGCGVTNPQRLLKIKWDEENITFTVPLQDAPRASFSNLAGDSLRIGNQPISTSVPSANEILKYVGGTWTPMPLNASSLSTGPFSEGYYLQTDASGYLSWAAGGGDGSVTSVTSASADIAVSAASPTPVLTLNSATAGGASDANKIAKLDGSGLLTLGMLPTVSIAKGGTNSITALTNNKVMISSGGAIVEGVASNTAKSGDTFVMRDSSGNIAGALGSFDQLALNGSVSGTLNISPPSSTFTSWDMTLPISAGTNGQVLSTNGSGVTSWISALTATTGFSNGGNSFGSDAILGTNDAYALNFETSGTTNMTILENGNVGIGTTAPSAKLDVNGTFKLGVNGSLFDRVIRCSGMATVLSTQITPNTSRALNFPCTGLTAGSISHCSFSTIADEAGYSSIMINGLPASAANTARFKIFNFDTVAIPANATLNITCFSFGP